MSDVFRGRTLQTVTGDRMETHHGFHMITIDAYMDDNANAHYDVKLQTTADPRAIITPGDAPRPNTALALWSDTLQTGYSVRLNVNAVTWEPARTTIGADVSTLNGHMTGPNQYELCIVPVTEVPK